MLQVDHEGEIAGIGQHRGSEVRDGHRFGASYSTRGAQLPTRREHIFTHR
jgi:hypothetical protein